MLYHSVLYYSDLDACLPDYGGAPQVPGDGDHGVFADPVGQAVVVLGVAQPSTRGGVDDQTPGTSTGQAQLLLKQLHPIHHSIKINLT